MFRKQGQALQLRPSHPHAPGGRITGHEFRTNSLKLETYLRYLIHPALWRSNKNDFTLSWERDHPYLMYQ